jgi:hypothetical protein
VRFVAKSVCVGAVAFALLIAIVLAYSTAKGYTIWWFRANGSVKVNGVSSGYLHKELSGRAWIVTRTDSRPSQSYLVSLNGSEHMIYCGDWHAPRFPVFPFGDVNPPCVGFLTDSEIQKADLPHSSTLSVKPGVIEFSTMSGKKVTASW